MEDDHGELGSHPGNWSTYLWRTMRGTHWGIPDHTRMYITNQVVGRNQVSGVQPSGQIVPKLSLDAVSQNYNFSATPSSSFCF